MTDPPTWSTAELEEARIRSEDHFRKGRHTEPLELYVDLFDEYRGIVEEVLEQTADLSELREQAENLFEDDRKFEVLRYISGPPVSEDDLKVLLKAKSLTRGRFKEEPELMDRLIEFIQD